MIIVPRKKICPFLPLYLTELAIAKQRSLAYKLKVTLTSLEIQTLLLEWMVSPFMSSGKNYHCVG